MNFLNSVFFIPLLKYFCSGYHIRLICSVCLALSHGNAFIIRSSHHVAASNGTEK